MKVLYPITLDVKKTNIQKHIKAFTSEGGTRELIITLVSGNDTIELTNEYVVSVVGVKPDGTEFANTATVSDGKIHYTLTTQNVAVEGEVDCHIRVVKTNELLYTSKFAIDVEKNLSDEETETSSNEWTELITALQEIQNISVKLYRDEGVPTTEPEDYPNVSTGNFYFDETNEKLYYSKTVTLTTVTWERIASKDELDTALDLKADKSTTYTKTEVDTALLTKADKSTTYTKTEVDTALSSKQNTLSEGNGIAIENDEVAVALESGASGNILGFDDEHLTLHGDTVAKDANFKTELAKYVYTETEVDNLLAAKQALLTAGNGIDLNNNTISAKLYSSSDNALSNSSNGLVVSKSALGYDNTLRTYLVSTDTANPLQPKLTAGANITISSSNVISATGGGNPITDTAKGSTISLTDSADSPLDAISIIGKSTQNGTPTIDTPIPIVDITSEEVEITNGTDTQQAELTKTLRGIPVESGGNYTDNNNQQWLCDTIERYKDGSGKYIQRVNVLTFNGTENWRDDGSGTKLYLRVNIPNSNTNNPTTLFELSNDIKSTGVQVDNTDNSYYIQASFETTGSLYFSPTQNGTRLNASQFKTYLESNNAKLYHPLQTPIETPLTSEELAELELSTYYPTTNISSNADVVVEYVVDIETALSTKQDKLTAGTNITIVDNVISASGGGLSYTFTDGLTESSGTVGIDLKSGTELQITNDQLDIDLSSYATQTDLSSKQDTIDSSHKLSADNVDDTSTTNKFVPTVASADYGKYLHNNNGTLEWSSVSGGGSYSGGDGIDITNDTISVDLKSGTPLQITSGELDIDLSNYATTTSVSGKEDKTTITTDTTSTTASLTLADNHEYRYTQDLTSLTLTMPSGDFISSIVFASGSTPTSMTYDSSIKWSGDDVTNGQFVPSADKDYDIMMYYNGLNVNGIVRGV